MRHLISFCVKRPVTALMFYCALAIFGVMAGLSMDIEFLPDLSVPKLLVSAAYSGLPAAEVRELVTIPLEDAFSSLKGIKKISSVSRQGVSVITLEFQWGRDMELAGAEVRELIDTAYAVLPEEAKKPVVLPINPGDLPILWLGVFPLNGDLALARRLSEREIKTRLQQVEGVGLITLVGGADEEIEVLVDQERALTAGISLGLLYRVLKASGISEPAGSLTEGETEYIVKTDARIKNMRELEALLIPLPKEEGASSSQVRLSDIAEVGPGYKDQESCFVLDGKEGIGLVVRRQEGYSPVRLSANVGKELKRIEESYGRDLSVIIVADQSDMILQSLKSLVLSILTGAAAAFAVILLMMKNPGAGLIILTSFPASILFCLIFLRITGRSLNIMSLGGLVLGIGMVVDNSIVVSENIRSLIKGGGMVSPDTEGVKETIVQATSEMAVSTFGSTITTLIVFLPVLFLPGIIGTLFTDLALSVAFSLLGSFFSSVTLVPVLSLLPAGRLLKNMKSVKSRERERPLEKIYRGALAAVIRKPLLVLPIFILLGLPGLLMIKRVPFEIMPGLSSAELDIRVELPAEEPMESIKKKTVLLQEALLGSGAVKRVWARSGGEERDVYYQADETMGKGVIAMTAVLREKGLPNSSGIEKVRELLSGNDLSADVRVPENILGPLIGATGGMRVKVSGRNPETARILAEELRDRLEKMTGAFSADTEKEEGIRIFPDANMSSVTLSPLRDALAKSGMDLAGVAGEISVAIKGAVPFRMEREGRDLDVRVRLKRNSVDTLEDLSGLPIRTNAGPVLVLGEVGELEQVQSPMFFLREGRKDVMLVESTAALLDDPALRESLHVLIRDSAGAELMSDSILNEQENGIMFSFFLALLLMYLFLGAQFESFIEPLFILLALPLGASGLIAGLALSGGSLNLYSSLSILVLLGVSVNTSIILFSTYKKFIIRPVSAASLVLRGSVRRIRPILATMLTTVTALLPVAIDPLRQSAQSGMAAAIIGGLLTSTLLTLFAEPLVFLAFTKGARPRISDTSP